MMKKFNPTSTMPERAVQAWQILTGKAMNRQSITYLDLSRLMFGKDAAGVLDKILGHVAFYCIENHMPPLTSIVVAKGRGIPGSEIPIDLTTIDAQREEVYEFDWYDVYPPSKDALSAAYTSLHNTVVEEELSET
jgi:hypothetical protein